MSKALDLVGKRFGMLTVVERRASDGKGQSMWLCRCDCGTEKVLRGHDLTQGKVRSCGCTRRYNCGLYKHGLSHTKLHSRWRNIKERCYNPKNPCYKHYGGRGIAMCDEWKNDFMAFYSWAMENGYTDELTVDRIDYNKGYSPQNCRLVGWVEQQNNKRNNRRFTVGDKTLTIAEWSRESGVQYRDIMNRLNYGYTMEEAIKPDFKKHHLCMNAENQNLYDLCVERGIRYSLVKQRVDRGWDIERALSTPAKERKKRATL